MANNELELLVFTVNNINYGINVAKVGEIVMNQHMTPAPDTARGVRGMLKLRNLVIPAIDLKKILNGVDTQINATTVYIVTNFNELDIAFIADSVSAIERFKWSDVSKPGNVIVNAERGVITGVVHQENSLISILDFEKIVSDIDPGNGLNVDSIDPEIMDSTEKRRGKTLLIAEDSKMLNKMITDTLFKAGFKVISTYDGAEAWDVLNACASKEQVQSNYSCLITDIEMPSMDGISLIEHMKTNSKFSGLPVIVFSSLVNDALRRQIEHLNIKATVTKPDIAKLVEVIDETLFGPVLAIESSDND